MTGNPTTTDNASMYDGRSSRRAEGSSSFLVTLFDEIRYDDDHHDGDGDGIPPRDTNHRQNGAGSETTRRDVERTHHQRQRYFPIVSLIHPGTDELQDFLWTTTTTTKSITYDDDDDDDDEEEEKEGSVHEDEEDEQDDDDDGVSKNPSSGTNHRHRRRRRRFRRLRRQHHALYEIQSIERSSSLVGGSFFVGSRVCSNGSLHVASSIDPLFFVLSYLTRRDDHRLLVASKKKKMKNDGGVRKWEPLDQLLADIPSVIRETVSSKSQYQHFCSTNHSLCRRSTGNDDHDGEDDEDDDDDDMILYKFQDERALSWLEKKFRATLQVVEFQQQQMEKMRRSGTHNKHGAASVHFRLPEDDDEEEKAHDDHDDEVHDRLNDIKEKKTSSNDDDEQQEDNDPSGSKTTSSSSLLSSSEQQRGRKKAEQMALQIVCDYLNEEWREKLCRYIQMELSQVGGRKRASNAHDTASNRRQAQKDIADDNNAPKSNADNVTPTCEENHIVTPTTGDGPGNNDEGNGNNKRKWEGLKGQADADALMAFTMGVGAGGANLRSSSQPLSSKRMETRGIVTPPPTVGMKRLAKVDKRGMKSLTSFFGARSGGPTIKKAKN